MIRSKSHKAKNGIDRKNFMEKINKIEYSETTIDNNEYDSVNDGTNEIKETDNIKVKGKKKKRNKKFNLRVVLSYIKKNSLWEFLIGLLLSAAIWGATLQYRISNISDNINNIEKIVIDKIKDTDTNIKDYKNDILAEIKDIRKELGDASKNLTEIKTFLYIKKK